MAQTESKEDWSLCTQTGVLQCLRMHDMRDIWGFNARLSRDKVVCRDDPHEPHIIRGPSNEEELMALAIAQVLLYGGPQSSMQSLFQQPCLQTKFG